MHYTVGKGDWKFKSAWLAQKRDYNNIRKKSLDGPSFCRRCHCGSNVASKHWLDMDMSWHESEHTARILDENLPADLPFRKLPNWVPEMEQSDLLHNLWLGAARDAVGSMLMEVVQRHEMFVETSSFNEALAVLCACIPDWCSKNNVERSVIDELSLTKLSVESLYLDYPSGMSKAFANRVAAAFVSDFLDGTADPELQMVQTCT